jgi:NitT/TauT family transport system ATP-binding protein
MSFVEVNDVAVSYDNFPVLQHVNLEVVEGAFVTIVGASGCGKSTFLRLLLSQEEPTAGSIRIAGVHLPPRPTPDVESSFNATRSFRI